MTMSTGGGSPQKTPGVRQFPMIDEWSIKEKLALASQVQRSGDQNWFSVSRALRSFLGDTRPDDTRDKVMVEDDKGKDIEKPVTSWFEKKNCARQYQDLLEKVQESKPKTSGRSNRRGSGRDGTAETDEDIIVKELTAKRCEELDQLIKKENEKLKMIQENLDLVTGPSPPEELMRKIWEDMIREEQEEKEKEEKNKIWLREREAKFNEATRKYRPGVKSVSGSPRTQGTTVITVTSKTDGQSPSKEIKPPGLSVVLIDTSDNQTPNPPPSSSPLLTSLLQNPPDKSPDGKPIPPGLTLGQAGQQPGTLGKGSPTKASPTKSQPSTRSAFFDPNSALANAAARQFTQTGSASPGSSQPGSGANTPRSMSPSKGGAGAVGSDVHTASPTLSKLLEIPISNVPGGNKLPPLPVIERSPRISSDSQEAAPVSSDVTTKESDVMSKQVKEELMVDDESANDGQVEPVAPDDQGVREEPSDEASLSALGEGEDSSVASMAGRRSPRSGRSDVTEENAKNKSTPLTRRSARQQTRGSVSKVVVNTPTTTPSVQAPPPLTAKPSGVETPKSVQTPIAPATRRSTRVRTKLESEGDNSNHPPSESSKITARVSVSEADQSTMDATAAPDSELMSEESSDGVTAGQKQQEPIGMPGAAGSVSGHMSTSTKRGPSSLLDIDSVPNSPASSNYGGVEESRDWKRWQRDMLEKLKTVRTHKAASEFIHPVKLKGYDEVVKRPMDLTTIQHALRAGHIRTLTEFKRDVMLVFINATMYNSSEIEVHNDALIILKEFLLDIEGYEKECPQIIIPPTSSGRNSAAGQTTSDGPPSISGEMKVEKASEKKAAPEGRTTPVPKIRTSISRRRGDSSSVALDVKDKDSESARSTRRGRGASTDTDPGAVTATPTSSTAVAGPLTPATGSTSTPSAPKTRSKK